MTPLTYCATPEQERATGAQHERQLPFSARRLRLLFAAHVPPPLVQGVPSRRGVLERGLIASRCVPNEQRPPAVVVLTQFWVHRLYYVPKQPSQVDPGLLFESWGGGASDSVG